MARKEFLFHTPPSKRWRLLGAGVLILFGLGWHTPRPWVLPTFTSLLEASEADAPRPRHHPHLADGSAAQHRAKNERGESAVPGGPTAAPRPSPACTGRLDPLARPSE